MMNVSVLQKYSCQKQARVHSADILPTLLIRDRLHSHHHSGVAL